MEYFEKAHVSKDDNIKRQLKKMLYGYKHNDNETIKKSTERNLDPVDSFFASFSEFNISTNRNDCYSNEEVNDSSTAENSSMTEKEHFGTQTNSTMTAYDDFESHNSYTSESKSEFLDNSQSISDQSNFKSEGGLSDVSEDNSSFNDYKENKISSDLCENTSTSSEIGNNTEQFDADGALAEKILCNLNFVQRNKSSKHSKRKLNVEQDSELEKSKKPNITSTSLQGMESPASLYDDLSIDSSLTEILSPPFVSVEADSVPSQSFSDILTGYNYSTTKIVPSDLPTFKNPHKFFSSNYEQFNHTEVELLDDRVDTLKNDSIVSEERSNIEDKSANLQHDLIKDEVAYDPKNYDATEQDFSENSIDTKITNQVNVYYCKNACIFIMKHPADIFIHGKVIVIPLAGTAEIFGYVLDKPCKVYAPSTNFAQRLFTIEKENDYYGLFGKLTATGLTVAEAEEIVTTLGEFDVVLKLQMLKNHKIDFIENNIVVTDLFSKFNKNVDNCFKKASSLLGTSIYLTKPWKCFEENPNWSEVLQHGLKKQSRGIVCGGKGTGKSTFIRYYVNKLLAQGPVLVIDIDPGQSEFTVAGNVSATIIREPLIGPNYTHLRKPERTLNIGMINVMENIRRYANAVTALLSYCTTNEIYQNMPWIVNTMGMCNNIGLKLMVLSILHLKPSFLLQLDSKISKNRFEAYLNAHAIKKLYFQNKHNYLFKNSSYPEYFDYAFFASEQPDQAFSSKRKSFSLAPRDERYLNFLAYFGELLDLHKTTELLSIAPYQVSTKCLSIGTNIKLAEEAIFKVINGKVVALCQRDNTDNIGGKIFTLDDKPELCHGHGLVRGIDEEKELLYIVTPMPVEELCKVNTLVYADWVPELRSQEKYLPKGTTVPYRTISLDEQKQLMFTPRRRFNPIQFFKMSRNA